MTRLFNGTIGDILNELLQNARRAGASGVDVDAMPVENGLRVTIADDGCGIDDPARVLALGASRWDAAVANGEDPAGMGVFSLAGKATTIESLSDSTGSAWRIEIPADAWSGDVEIAVDRSERRKGTSISFLLPGACKGLVENAVRDASQYYPIPVQFAGREMPRKDFLSGAIHVEEWNGSRIGIFQGQPYHWTPTVNFHGVTISSRLFEVAQVGRQAIHARIDIGHTPELQLVLPARKEFVENAGLTALKAACEVACYRAIATQKSHSLSFENYSRAATLGVPLAEAEAALTAWEPDIADNDTGTEAGERRTITGDEFLMDAHEAHFGQIIARALRGKPIRSKLVDRNSRFEGYSWYDTLREMRDPTFVVRTNAAVHTVDAIAADPPLDAITIAKEIHLEYAIDDQGSDNAARERVEADIVLTFPDGCRSDGIEDVTIAYVASDALQPDILVDLLDNACFSAWNDSDADSWDTQHDRFLRDARELSYRILVGENAAIASQFRDAIARIMWTLPKGKRVEIAFTHDSPIAVEVSDLPGTN
ncbi:MAG: ATP-binding protein [Croceicoccus sp.]|nr:ATP-binding protein [Croceicoccus sp.]